MILRVQVCAMRTGISVSVSAADRRRLEAIVADPKTPQKHVWRARIILLTADGIGTTAIMAATGKSKTCVWRWQERFMEAGVDGLLRDKTRPPGKAPIADERVAEVVRLTLTPPPHEATHWTVRAMAKTVGMAVATVQDIWKAHGLAPHSWRSFKLSNDPAFVSKLEDIVGLVCRPAGPCGGAVDRREVADPGARPHPARPADEEGPRRHHDPRLQAQRHHDVVRRAERAGWHVTGRNMQRHRHQEFIRFLNALDRDIPAGKLVHAILDNYAAHKTPEVRRWLARHPRWTFHFTPTSSSWLNAVEGFFAKLTRRRLKHGVFHSVVDLQAAINRFVEEHNHNPKPFVWRADPERHHRRPCTRVPNVGVNPLGRMPTKQTD